MKINQKLRNWPKKSAEEINSKNKIEILGNKNKPKSTKKASDKPKHDDQISMICKLIPYECRLKKKDSSYWKCADRVLQLAGETENITW